ncbi:MAG: NFACT family protein [Bacillota bacterium]|nr:NFACT family protein [Bacillota bacterium]
MDFDGLSLRACLGLLRRHAAGARLRHVLQPSKLSVSLAFRVSGSPLWLVLSAEPAAACVFAQTGPPGAAVQPSTFCTILRRQLSGLRLTDVTQDGWDRIARLRFAGQDELGSPTGYSLIAELMGKHSNIICVRDDGRIVDSIKRIGYTRSRVRQVLPGRSYEPPPAQHKLAPDALSGDDLAAALSGLEPGDATGAVVGPAALLRVVAGIGPKRARAIWHEAAAGGVETAGAPGLEALARAVRRAADTADASHAAGAGLAAGTADAGGGDGLEQCAFVAAQFRRSIEAAGGGPPDAAGLHSESAAGRDPERERLSAHVSAAVRTERERESALTAQAAAVGDAGVWLRMGNALLASLGLVRERLEQLAAMGQQPPGALVLDLPDHQDARGVESGEGGGLIRVELAPGEEPGRAAQRHLERYAELRRSGEKLRRLLAESSARVNHLLELQFQLEQPLSPQELGEVAAEAAAAGVRDPGPSAAPGRAGTAAHPGPSQPVSVRTPGDFEILVGRNNRQNDALLRRGADDDIWLHARGAPGAHVLLRRAGRQGDVPAPDLRYAAAIAAGQSEAARSASVPVDYTELRNVRRAKGARPGFVTYIGEQTVHVRPTPLSDLLRRGGPGSLPS